MTFHNQLRQGKFDEPYVLITYRLALRWEGDCHLNLNWVEGLVVSGVEVQSGGVTAVTHAGNRAYYVHRLIVAPHPRSPQFKPYARWAQGGASCALFQPLEGVVKQRILVMDPAPFPPQSYSGALSYGHNLLVKPNDVGSCLQLVLPSIGIVSKTNQQVTSRHILAALTQQVERR